MSVHGVRDARRALLLQRLDVYADVVTPAAATFGTDDSCLVCLRRRCDVLLACAHALCGDCARELVDMHGTSDGIVQCIVCGMGAQRVGAPTLVGRGLRLLALGGSTFRAAEATSRQLALLERATGARVHELFDVLGGVGVGALVALASGIARMDAAAIAQLAQSLRRHARQRPLPS